MNRLCLLVLVLAATTAVAVEPPQPKNAEHRIVGVTVYPNSALVTREVTVPEGAGHFELVVTPLPPQTINSSLYSEGNNGIQVLATRYRTRPIKEDTREEVRKLQGEQKLLQAAAQRLQNEMHVLQQNIQMLAKLEEFTSITLKQLTEKGLNGDATIALARFIMEQRTERNDALVKVQLDQQNNQEQMQFLQRKLNELAAGSNKTERDAVIVVEKKEAPAGKVRLNYLVDSASWRPHYKFRADKKKDAVQLEYLAAVMQQTGEDWGNVNVVLSTAQPMLNAAPPDLKELAVAVVPRTAVASNAPAGRAQAAQMPAPQSAGELSKQARDLRGKAQIEYRGNNDAKGSEILNSAAALEQACDLLASHDVDKQEKQPIVARGEGPSVTHHLANRLSIPSRHDEQVIEVAKIDMTPEYFYKAVPVLTPHVYRLANLTNKSQYVLLPGEATMYVGTDFVGRARLPLVAVGEQFTAGFGVDPQLQAQRHLVEKTKSMQGDNQVLKYEYRILVSSYKTEPVRMQVWDRLPHSDSEAVGVSLVKTKPEISQDPLYVRESKPNNLLRWDVTVDPTMTGEKALSVQYEFKLELGRQMMISSVAAK